MVCGDVAFGRVCLAAPPYINNFFVKPDSIQYIRTMTNNLFQCMDLLVERWISR